MKIFLILVIGILIFLIAAYLKFFHDIEILWLPSQIGCTSDYVCKFSDFHNACGNINYHNFKGHTPFVFDEPACECSLFVCSKV